MRERSPEDERRSRAEAVEAPEPRAPEHNVLALQRAAGNAAVAAFLEQQRAFWTSDDRPSAALSERVLARQGVAGPARVAIRRALTWIGRRGKNVSRHVARHTRHIAGRAVHSVFRSPNQVKKLAERTLASPDNVVVQQGGRLRYVIEKQFSREIGRNGERILRIVIEGTGRIVTAFPVTEFTRAGVVAGITYVAVENATAEARTRLAEVERETAQRLEDAEPSWAHELLLDIVTFGLYGGQLNVGEDVHLWADRRVREIQRQAVEEAIASVEAAEQVTLDAAERERIRDLVTVGLAFPDLLEEEDAP